MKTILNDATRKLEPVEDPSETRAREARHAAQRAAWDRPVRFTVERRNAWGRVVYAVLDTYRVATREQPDARLVARCDSQALAANVCTAMNAFEKRNLEALNK